MSGHVQPRRGMAPGRCGGGARRGWSRPLCFGAGQPHHEARAAHRAHLRRVDGEPGRDVRPHLRLLQPQQRRAHRRPGRARTTASSRAAPTRASRPTSSRGAAASASGSRCPADFGDRELVWKITANGKTEYAFATLKPDYIIDERIMMMNNGGFGGRGQRLGEPDNVPPSIRLEGPAARSVKVGEPLALTGLRQRRRQPARRHRRLQRPRPRHRLVRLPRPGRAGNAGTRAGTPGIPPAEGARRATAQDRVLQRPAGLRRHHRRRGVRGRAAAARGRDRPPDGGDRHLQRAGHLHAARHGPRRRPARRRRRDGHRRIDGAGTRTPERAAAPPPPAGRRRAIRTSASCRPVSRGLRTPS